MARRGERRLGRECRDRVTAETRNEKMIRRSKRMEPKGGGAEVMAEGSIKEKVLLKWKEGFCRL